MPSEARQPEQVLDGQKKFYGWVGALTSQIVR